MANTWERMLDSDGILPAEETSSEFNAEDYDERQHDSETESEYFEFLSSSRQLPSARWGVNSTRDPAQKAEWDV